MAELTRQEYEQAEVQAAEARQRFLEELARVPTVADAWQRYRQAEREAFEARRALRESEAFGA